jgi:hypothetical protein
MKARCRSLSKYTKEMTPRAGAVVAFGWHSVALRRLKCWPWEIVSDSYLFEMHEEVLDSVLTEQSSRTPPGEHSSVPSFLSFCSSSTFKDFISDAEAFK